MHNFGEHHNMSIGPPSTASTSERGNEGDAWPCLPLADRATHTSSFLAGHPPLPPIPPIRCSVDPLTSFTEHSNLHNSVIPPPHTYFPQPTTTPHHLLWSSDVSAVARARCPSSRLSGCFLSSICNDHRCMTYCWCVTQIAVESPSASPVMRLCGLHRESRCRGLGINSE